MKATALLSALLLAAPLTFAQTAAPALTTAPAAALTVDHLTQKDLLDLAASLREKAKGPSGSASVKLKEYPNHFTMIALRDQDGGAEIHQFNADFFFVVSGSATLVTGGSVIDSKSTHPGEITGTSIEGGTRTELAPGDFVHIPATLPHQLLLKKGGPCVYYVIKVKEK